MPIVSGSASFLSYQWPWLFFFIEPEKLRRLVFYKKPVFSTTGDNSVKKSLSNKILLCLLCIYVFFQLALPARSWFYPGNVFWTEEGYRMSWKMMLRKKAGTIHFKLSDPVSGKQWTVDPADKFTASHTNWLAICPDIVWQYAQRLKKEFNGNGYPKIKVYAIDWVSLNRDPPRLLIDTTVDLGAVKWHPFRHSDWIMPQ